MVSEWPDWEISYESASKLACYVDPEAKAAPLGARLRDTWGSSGSGVGRARAGELYDLLLGAGLAYAADPWNPNRYGLAGGAPRQRIRTPAEVLQGVGCCLDFTLLFAGMALAANIRAFIALTLGPEERHAMVILDVGRPHSEMGDPGSKTGPDFWQLDAGGQGLWQPEGPESAALPWRNLEERWLAVDITLVARHGAALAHSFDQACRPSLSDAEWVLVDVDAARIGQEAYEPPSGRAAYPIHTYLPELPPFREYESRRDLTGLLQRGRRPEQPRSIVLQGPGGRGKSLLAQRLAWSADSGCGWLLTATDVPTLKAELAAAEQAELGAVEETGERAERPNAAEVDQLAFAALRRLSSADVPWVVVIDNCDLERDAQGLAPFIPRPQRAGQVVILTTRLEEWAAVRDDAGWQYLELPPLTAGDLKRLGLSADLAESAGDPLVAEALAALRSDGQAGDLPDDAEPHALVWQLMLAKLGPDSVAARLARLLAWCPPLPVDVIGAPLGMDADVIQAAAGELARLQFVAPVAAVGRSGGAQARPGGQGAVQVQLHRLFAEAIRDHTWRAGAQQVMEVLYPLLTSPWGHALFTESAERTALSRLEDADLERAAADPGGDPGRTALAWHGLGHIRERRGPVKASQVFFERARPHLDGDRHPYAAAETEIGLARIVFQNDRAAIAELRGAQQQTVTGRRWLEARSDQDSLQLSEQGNALYWLIQRKLAGQEKVPERRRQLLEEVQEQLWRSFERRLEIARGAGATVRRVAPRLEDGLGAERAYYNLAGVGLSLAKATFECGITPEAGEEAGKAERRRLAGIAASLDEAARVYREVAELRARRYRDAAHPHHAACINGLAIIAYHRAAFLGEPAQVVEASLRVTQALAERWQVALGAPGGQPAISNGDVAKSLDLLSKIAAEAQLAIPGSRAARMERALRASAAGVAELIGWETQGSD
jgi:hypothetical protein